MKIKDMSVRVSIGTQDILLQGLYGTPQNVWAFGLRSINECLSLVDKSEFSWKIITSNELNI
jgi:hypothetical protein